MRYLCSITRKYLPFFALSFLFNQDSKKRHTLPTIMSTLLFTHNHVHIALYPQSCPYCSLPTIMSTLLFTHNHVHIALKKSCRICLSVRLYHPGTMQGSFPVLTSMTRIVPQLQRRKKKTIKVRK